MNWADEIMRISAEHAAASGRIRDAIADARARTLRMHREIAEQAAAQACADARHRDDDHDMRSPESNAAPPPDETDEEEEFYQPKSWLV